MFWNIPDIAARRTVSVFQFRVGQFLSDRNEVQGTNELFKVDMPLARLSLVAQRSSTPRGQVHSPSRFHAALHRDMFALCWGPLVRAVAALLEAAHLDDTAIIADGMTAMRAVSIFFLFAFFRLYACAHMHL
jgi:hypothetical protein